MRKPQKNCSDKSRSPCWTFGTLYKRDMQHRRGTVTVRVKWHKMFRTIWTILLLALTLDQFSVDAIDISQYKNVRLDFQGGDALDHGDASFKPKDRGPMFIGDLILGKRLADETVFRRILDFENPTDTVQSTTLNISISDGSIHYISARNTQGSYAVVCDKTNLLGGNKGALGVRLPSNSRATLTLIIAAHSYAARPAPSTYFVTDRIPYESLR